MARDGQQSGLFGSDTQDAETSGTSCTAFDQFWRLYPRREKKLRAAQAWHTLKPSKALIAQIMAALAWQVQRPEWTKEHGQFIPLPSSWLRAGQWLDEQITPMRSAPWWESCAHEPPCENYQWHLLKVAKEQP